jgi:hypothetical protein
MTLDDLNVILPRVSPVPVENRLWAWIKSTKVELEAGQKHNFMLSGGSQEEKDSHYRLVWDAKFSAWSVPILPKLLEPTDIGAGVGQEFRLKRTDSSGRFAVETSVYAFAKLESNGWGKRGDNDLLKVELEFDAGRKYTDLGANWDASAEITAGPELAFKNDVLKIGAAGFLALEGIGQENAIAAGLKLSFTLGTPKPKAK